jgi:hypothetical protein
MNLIVDKLFQICNKYNKEVDLLQGQIDILMKKHAETEERTEKKIAEMEKKIVQTEDTLLQEMQTGYTLIGYAETNEPVFIRRKCTYQELCIILTEDLQRGRLLVDSLCQLPHINKLDFQDMFYTCGPCAYFEGDNVWTSVVDDKNQLIDGINQLVAVFAKHGVQLLYDGKPI